MLDLRRIQRIKLRGVPRFQKVIGHALLTPNYYFPGRRVRIELEHVDRLPSDPVIYAINHTDRYNYWPFQYQLWQQLTRYTSAWVKGKYYENPALGMFMELTNNIPTVSRGYLVARDFLAVTGRVPTEEEYTALRNAVEGKAAGSPKPATANQVPQEVLTRPRNMLGRDFHPGNEDYATAVNDLFRQFMQYFVDLHVDAFAKKLDLIVFPEGTRSVTLTRGRIGLAQIALKFRKTIVPVSCNGSDLVYPGSSPWGQPGHIIYRFGHPIGPDEMREFEPGEDYVPFSPEAESTHRDNFQGLVDLVMERIAEQLDARHQPLDDTPQSDERGAHRFV